MTELSELLTKANKEGWSTREIEAKARAAGHQLSHATAGNYLSGAHPRRPSDNVLRAFEAVFGTPLEKLRAASKLPTAVTQADLPDEVARLTPRQWEAVKQIIRAMADPEGRDVPVGGGLSVVPDRPVDGAEALAPEKAARTAASAGQRDRNAQDADAMVPDPEGPESGA